MESSVLSEQVEPLWLLFCGARITHLWWLVLCWWVNIYYLQLHQCKISTMLNNSTVLSMKHLHIINQFFVFWNILSGFGFHFYHQLFWHFLEWSGWDSRASAVNTIIRPGLKRSCVKNECSMSRNTTFQTEAGNGHQTGLFLMWKICSQFWIVFLFNRNLITLYCPACVWFLSWKYLV